MKRFLAALLICAVAPLSAEAARPELVQEMDLLASDPTRPISEEAINLSHGEALYFADEVNTTTIRRLLILHKQRKLELPTNLFDAFRFKVPGLFFTRPSR